MDLKSSIKAYCRELLETSTSGDAGGYLTKKSFRKPTKKDKNSPTGFESSPKPNMYTKTMKFKIVDPKARIDAKDLWKGEHLEEIKVNTPIIKAKLNSGDEDDILVYKRGVNYNDYKDEINDSLDGDFTNKDKVTWSLISVPGWENNNKKYWWNDDEIDFPSINESRYTQFKKSTSKPKPREILHRAIKEIQLKLDEVNRLIEFTTRIKGELQENDQEIEYLKRTKDSLYKIQDKLKEAFQNISKINEIKINKPMPFSKDKLKDIYGILNYDEDNYNEVETNLHDIYSKHIPHDWFEDENMSYFDMILKLPEDKQKQVFNDFLQLIRQNNIQI